MLCRCLKFNVFGVMYIDILLVDNLKIFKEFESKDKWYVKVVVN